MYAQLKYKEPTPILYRSDEKNDVSLRIGAYIIAIEKVAKTLKFRGIYA